MGVEIERKYLVNHELWKKIKPNSGEEIKQAYLSTDPTKIIRVRTKADKGYITIKSKSVGDTRLEYEYEIPHADAIELLQSFCTNFIEKVRYYVQTNGKLWEVDEFTGDNEGLIMAEVELESEDDVYTLPDWVTVNVSADKRYANSNLTLHPYKTW